MLSIQNITRILDAFSSFINFKENTDINVIWTIDRYEKLLKRDITNSKEYLCDISFKELNNLNHQGAIKFVILNRTLKSKIEHDY